MSRWKASFSAALKESCLTLSWTVAISPKALGGASRADQPCLWTSTFRASSGCTALGLLCSSVVAHLPLRSPPIRGHIGSWSLGTAPLSPHLLLRWVPTPLLTLILPLQSGKGATMVQARMPPRGNFRYALLSQGESRLPVFHLYQDCLHTFVIKGSVWWKFLNYLYG